MDNNSIEFTLPPAPRGLCFDRNDFVKTNFSVDNFLVEHQNAASLEKMRDDLGIYLKVLRLAMIELINKDYANFVNLSATLIGFDKAIEKIQLPLGQINEEVLTVKKCLENAMRELSMWLNQRHGLLKKKQLLNHYSQTINGLNTLEKILKTCSDNHDHIKIVLADRAAMQFNQLKFSISKCESLLKEDQKMKFNNIEIQLIQILNELLLQFWNDKDEENLLKALLTLTSLNRVAETELLIKKEILAPLLQDIINEPALQKNTLGLHGIYDILLNLLETKLKTLYTVMLHSKLAYLDKKYNFLVNCFWCEVESRLEVNLASIFAPGNPKIFYKRYNESVEFIRKLEKYCSDAETVKLLRATPEYKSFQKRWNLPVYFQIRFQEIAGNFESILQSSPSIENKGGFILKETARCWIALENCWSDEVFIEALTHKFWKLSLQLLSRYATWGKSFCSQRKNLSMTESRSVNKKLIDNSINIYIDIHTLQEKIPLLLNNVETRIKIDNQELLKKSIRPSIEYLEETKNEIKKCIVNELFEYFDIQLKQVSDIPRLYRKTNRNIPTKPCSYIDVISKIILEFNENALKKLDNIFLADIFRSLFNIMTVSYFKYVQEVLTSVQKTEESLRRLKQIRENISQPSTESIGITDGDKIRLQLKVDVVSYGKLVEVLSVDVNSVHKYIELSDMVSDAVKSIDIK